MWRIIKNKKYLKFTNRFPFYKMCFQKLFFTNVF